MKKTKNKKNKREENNPYICKKCGNVKAVNFGSALATTVGKHKRCSCKPEKKKGFFRRLFNFKKFI